MRKFNLKKIAAFVLAGTMAIGMSATVFAADPSSEALKDKGKFTKTFITDDDTYQPAATFTFMQPTGANPTNNEEVSGIPVLNGAEGPVVTLGNANFEAATTTGPKTDDVSITYGDLTKVVPGVYKYSFSEKASDDTNIKYDTTTKYLYVFVALDKEGNKTVTGASMTDEASNKKVPGITNEYGKDKDNKDTLHDLTIKKNITGDMANVHETFTFKVKVKSSDGKAKYKVVVTRKGKSISTSINEDTETPIENIGKGDSITIYSLAKGDTYTVEEVRANTNGYKAIIDGKASDDGKTNGTFGDGDVEVNYENNKKAATPTGIIMNYAPYIAMLAAACVLAVVFFNRRREDA